MFLFPLGNWLTEISFWHPPRENISCTADLKFPAGWHEDTNCPVPSCKTQMLPGVGCGVVRWRSWFAACAVCAVVLWQWPCLFSWINVWCWTNVQGYLGLRAQDLQEAKDQLLVETSDMLRIPLFTAEALLRNHGEWCCTIFHLSLNAAQGRLQWQEVRLVTVGVSAGIHTFGSWFWPSWFLAQNLLSISKETIKHGYNLFGITY